MEATIQIFTEEEIKSFFHILDANRVNASTNFKYNNAVRNEALFYIMYYCALRVSEVAILNIDDYNMLKKEVYCKRIKGGINNTIKIMDDKVLTALNRHIRVNQPTGFLFMNLRDNQSLSRKTIDYIVKKVCIEAKITNKTKWHSHTFRHTKAIQLIESGIDIKELQYWLGHKSIANTQLYYEFAALQHLNIYEQLMQRGNDYKGKTNRTEASKTSQVTNI